jgi:hypothetical protein
MDFLIPIIRLSTFQQKILLFGEPDDAARSLNPGHGCISNSATWPSSPLNDLLQGDLRHVSRSYRLQMSESIKKTTHSLCRYNFVSMRKIVPSRSCNARDKIHTAHVGSQHRHATRSHNTDAQ